MSEIKRGYYKGKGECSHEISMCIVCTSRPTLPLDSTWFMAKAHLWSPTDI